MAARHVHEIANRRSTTLRQLTDMPAVALERARAEALPSDGGAGGSALPQLRLETSYRFRWQGFGDDDDRDGAISNAVFLNLRYDLPRFLTSR